MNVFKGLALVLLLAAFVGAMASTEDPKSATANTAPTSVKGNVRFGRVVEAPQFIVGAILVNNLTSEGHADLNKVTAQSIETNSMTATNLATSYISSTSGSIVIDADLVITSNTPVESTAFLAEDIVIGGVKQWKMVRHENFEEGAEGWSLLETSSCSPNGDRFLGGHCNAAHGSIRKTFDKLPAHKQLRVTARYHFIDNWQGETAFLQLGNKYVWSDRAKSVGPGQGLQMCGSAKHAETRMSAPIDVTIPHDASFLEVAFGSHGREGEDACERSFGVDDVMVYVR